MNRNYSTEQPVFKDRGSNYLRILITTLVNIQNRIWKYILYGT